MIQCRLLLRICEIYPQFLSQIDLIAGTSAGAIVGMALANNVSPKDISSWFETEAPKIFSETYTREITSLGNMISAQFETEELKQILQKQVGNKTLEDINQYRVLIPSFNLQPQFEKNIELPLSPCRVPHPSKGQILSSVSQTSPFEETGSKNSTNLKEEIDNKTKKEKTDVEMESSLSASSQISVENIEHVKENFSKMNKDFSNRWKPEFLHNFPSSLNSSTLIVDAILRSTAAPTYFPIYQGYVDGGTFANNPSLAAITTSIHYGIPLEDIVVLSLGTGFNPSSLDSSVYGKGNWGVYQWAPYLIGLLMDANTEAITYQSQILLNDSYCRINPMLSTSVGLGDASAIPDLKKIGDEFDLTETKTWLEKVWGINDSKNNEPEHEEPPQSYCSIQ